MRITGVYSPKLLLKAQAPFLRLLTALVEQFTFVDLKDNATASEVLVRVASYLRELAHSAAATDSLVSVGVVKNLVDAATTIEQATRSAGKGLSDAVALMDKAALGVTRSASDYYLASDSAIRSAQKLLDLEKYKATDALSYAAQTFRSDNQSAGDAAPVLSPSLVWLESGEYVEGFGYYADEAYFLKTPQAVETEFFRSVVKSLSEEADTSLWLEKLAKTLGRAPEDSLMVSDGASKLLATSAVDATTSINDTAVLNPTVCPHDYPYIMESVAADSWKSLVPDSATGSDTYTGGYAKQLADLTDTATDAAILAPHPFVSDLVLLTENLVRAAVTCLADTETVVHTDPVLSVRKSIALELVATSDVVVRSASQFRYLEDTFRGTESRVAEIAKPFADNFASSDAPAKTFYISFLEGGEYSVSGYFEAADYVVGGIAVGDSLTHVP